MAAPLLAAIPALLGKAGAVAVKAGAAAAKGAAAAAKGAAKGAAAAGKATGRGLAQAGKGMGRGLGKLGKGLKPKLKTTKVKSFGKKKLKSKVKDKLKNKARDKSKKKLSKNEKDTENDKKLSKKSKIDSFNKEEGISEKTDQVEVQEQETTTSLKKPQHVVEKIKPADTRLPPIQQLKINSTNIKNFLVSENNKRSEAKKLNDRNARKEQSQDKFASEERKLEFSPFGGSDIGDQELPKPSGGNIFQKLFEFIGLILLGIFVNALPGLIESVKGIINSVVDFITPIMSGFNLVKDFFTGEVDREGSDVDKKRVDDSLKGFEEDGGLIDQMAEKLGPLGGIVKMLKPVVGMFRKQAGGKKIVKAKKGGKEGFLNKETGKFTPKQWTSAEREDYESNRTGTQRTGDGGPGQTPSSSTGSKENLVMEPGSFSGKVSITSPFGPRILDGAHDEHMGVDIAGKVGTPLVAFTQGKVLDKGYHRKGYGNYVAWVDKFNIEHFYAHMNSPAFVNKGQKVKKGTVLGEMGNTGKSSGPHLHWEASTKIGDTGRPKSSYLTRFDPLSKYPYTAPFGGAIEKSSKNGSQGGGLPIIEKISNVPSENESNTIIIQPYRTIQNQIVYT
jgi:murein DD-endopeptidase MepM/ murein hydrolase activator NlpD